MTAVVGAIGRSDVEFLGSEVSFLGFFVIFSLRCSPFAIYPPNRRPDMGLQSLNGKAEMPVFVASGVEVEGSAIKRRLILSAYNIRLTQLDLTLSP